MRGKNAQRHTALPLSRALYITVTASSQQTMPLWGHDMPAGMVASPYL